MPIRITSKRDGFWRCGIKHSTTPTIYPDGRFTPQQLAQLKSDPMLIVDELPPEPTPQQPTPQAVEEPPAKEKPKGGK